MYKPRQFTQSELLYIGTHRRAHRTDASDIAFGIYAFRSESPDKRLRALGMVETPQPGWIAAHPDGRFLYAVNEVGRPGSTEQAGVSAFAIDSDSGALTPLNSQPTSPLPCHCEVDASGRYLLVATFGGGTVELFPLMPDGYIGPATDIHRHSGSSVHPNRQTQPHPHAASLDPANRFVLVPDLGTDQIIVYELDQITGKLISRPERSVSVAPGSGPRHVAFDPHARFVYLMNEISATITVFAYDNTLGALRELQTVDLLPVGFSGLRSGAEIGIHPTGKFLYATTRSHTSSGEPSVRGLDSLVWFKIDEADGLLQLQGRTPSGGEIPRSFAFDNHGDHLYVGHQCSGTVVTFRIESQTGTPIATGEIVTTPVPVCLRFISKCRPPE